MGNFRTLAVYGSYLFENELFPVKGIAEKMGDTHCELITKFGGDALAKNHALKTHRKEQEATLRNWVDASCARHAITRKQPLAELMR